MPSQTTIIEFLDSEGRALEIDHLGIAYPENRGEFAIYEGDNQIGDFMLTWALERPEVKAGRTLPPADDLIEEAKLALVDDPRVLTESVVAAAFAASGLLRNPATLSCVDSASTQQCC